MSKTKNRIRKTWEVVTDSLAVRLVLVSAFFFLMMGLTEAKAFSFPWSQNFEARYNEQVQKRIEAENKLIQSLIDEFVARGDLSFDKAEKAADQKNTEELNRLADVAEQMTAEIQRLQILRDNKAEYNFKFCFTKPTEDEHCFSQAFLK